MGCGGGVVEAHFSVQLKPKPSLTIKGYSSHTSYPNVAKWPYFGAKVFLCYVVHLCRLFQKLVDQANQRSPKKFCDAEHLWSLLKKINRPN